MTHKIKSSLLSAQAEVPSQKLFPEIGYRWVVCWASREEGFRLAEEIVLRLKEILVC